MTRILVDASLQQASVGMAIEVTGAELHYLKNVRRHVGGDTVVVLDRAGNSFEATIVAIDNAAATLELLSLATDLVTTQNIHLLAAVPKEKIMDDVIRKISELGVARFTPIISERTSVVPGVPRIERWQRIADQSMKQCRRNRALGIESPQKFEDALSSLLAEHRFFLHPSGEHAAGKMFSERSSGEIALMVGPEGGFTDPELRLATEHSFRSVRLGQSILRIETAIVVAAVMSIAMLGGYDS